MYLLNTVASRFVILFQLRWFISDWLCCDTCARVIWLVIQFWSAWSNHDDVWHVRDVHFPRLFWLKYVHGFASYVMNTQLMPPRWAHITYNSAALLADTCRYMVQVIHRFLELLVLSAWSLEETDVHNWTGWNYSELFLSPNTHWIWWYDVRSSLLVPFFSTLSQHSAIAMGMVESQKISRYPSRHPTVLQPISGRIPSLCSLSVTKFPYGNVDCALEKLHRRHRFSPLALYGSEIAMEKPHAFASGYMHVSGCTKNMWWTSSCIWSWDLQHLTKDMDHHVAKCHARPFLRGMSSLWFCFYDAKSWRILWQFGQLCCHSTGFIDCDCGPRNGRW